MPLPSARPVHPAWSALHQRVAAGLQNATVHIYLPGTATGWSPQDGTTTGPGTDLYTGRARVMPIRRQAEQTLAVGQPITARRYNVSLPIDAPAIPAGALAGAVIHVTAADANADPTLTGARLRVIDAAPASAALERVLVAVLDETNQGA